MVGNLAFNFQKYSSWSKPKKDKSAKESAKKKKCMLDSEGQITAGCDLEEWNTGFVWLMDQAIKATIVQKCIQ